MTPEGERTVLLVEDDEATSELERRALARCGLRARIASTVHDALEAVEHESFSAILLDYQLPDGDPWAVVEAAKRKTPPIPVILVTAMGSERVAAEAMRHGVTEYVKKTDTFWDQLPAVVDRAARLAQTEERLKRSDALFRLLADNATDLIWTTDPDGMVTYISPGCRTTLGLEPAEVVGRTLLDIVHPDDRELAAPAKITGADKPQAPVTYRCVRKDGVTVWLETNVFVPQGLERETNSAFVGIARDVTARKAVDDLVAAHQLRLAEAQAIAHVGSWDWNVQTDELIWSDELFRIYGVDSRTFRPCYASYLECVHPDDRDRADALVKGAARDRRSFEFEHRVLRPDGEIRWLRARGQIHLDGAGAVARLAGTAQDISEQRRLRDALNQRATDLARSNAELEGFAYAASHDLRAPLRAIGSLATWLVADEGNTLTEESREQVALLQNRVKRMDRLLVDLLEYSRVGRLDSTMTRVDVAELLAEVSETSHNPAGLAIEAKSPMPILMTSRVQLKRVFMNLVDNAIKHHDRPSGSVVIASQQERDAFTFTVTDDGPGIPAQHHDRVFQMFQTLKSRDSVEGSGMGLALVRKIVETVGGHIDIEANAGRGTTFAFTWPTRVDNHGTDKADQHSTD